MKHNTGFACFKDFQEPFTRIYVKVYFAYLMKKKVFRLSDQCFNKFLVLKDLTSSESPDGCNNHYLHFKDIISNLKEIYILNIFTEVKFKNK